MNIVLPIPRRHSLSLHLQSFTLLPSQSFPHIIAVRCLFFHLLPFASKHFRYHSHQFQERLVHSQKVTANKRTDRISRPYFFEDGVDLALTIDRRFSTYLAYVGRIGVVSTERYYVPYGSSYIVYSERAI